MSEFGEVTYALARKIADDYPDLASIDVEWHDFRSDSLTASPPGPVWTWTFKTASGDALVEVSA